MHLNIKQYCIRWLEIITLSLIKVVYGTSFEYIINLKKRGGAKVLHDYWIKYIVLQKMHIFSNSW